jgi:Lrp/AsnC family transcriptional regulator of ectoine degradation
MIKLDDRDIEILRILSREARISKSDLARRINLSPSPCWQRLKRLEEVGLIRGYHADVALGAVASTVDVFVTVELDRHKTESFRKFEALVAERDEIVACWALGGGFDYLLEVVTRDIDSYQRLIDSLLDHGPGVARYYTYVVTKSVKRPGPLPFDVLLGESGDETAASRSE